MWYIYLLSPDILYFFGYKTDFFSFQNNPKNLDLCYKTDLDPWDCLGMVKLVTKLHRNDLVIVVVLEWRKKIL